MPSLDCISVAFAFQLPIPKPSVKYSNIWYIYIDVGIYMNQHIYIYIYIYIGEMSVLRVGGCGSDRCTTIMYPRCWGQLDAISDSLQSRLR